MFIVSSFQLGFLHGINILELVVIAYITIQMLILHMINQIDHGVQEWNIVGNKNESILIVIQVTFQPFNMDDIQIVGRLIQKQDVRFFKEKLGQQDFGTLAAA